MTIGSDVFFTIFGLSGYVINPLALALGWSRWIYQQKTKSVWSALSLAGFILASSSDFCGALLIAYAQVHKITGYRDPSAEVFFRCGFWLSFSGFLLGLCGVWRSNPLRWYGPIASFGAFSFWLIATFWD
jgi:hypothetical protein